MKMKLSGKLAHGALAVIFSVVTFAGGMTVSTKTAEANPARLTAIKRVIGLHERKHRKQIQAMLGVNPARTPWCGAATAYAVKKAGGRPVKGHLGANNWSRFGKRVSLRSAHKGDVVVLRFKRGHHVGIFSRHLGKGRIEVCGGNMSNRFKCSSYRSASVKAVRR